MRPARPGPIPRPAPTVDRGRLDRNRLLDRGILERRQLLGRGGLRRSRLLDRSILDSGRLSRDRRLLDRSSCSGRTGVVGGRGIGAGSGGGRRRVVTLRRGRGGRAACFLGASRRAVGRSGFGVGALAGTSTPNRAAIWGSNGPRRFTVAVSSSERASGAAAGTTRARTGKNATASSTADQRSGPSVGCNEAVVASARRVASEPGRDAGLRRLRRQPQGPHHPADLEGRLDVGEPQGQLLVLLRHQRRLERGGERTGGLVAGDQRVVGRRHDAAQVAQVEVLELALRGLGAVQPVGDASRGSRSLAIFITAASGISGLPSAFRRTLSSRSRWRTAAIPCRVSSATVRCSSGVAASTSVRCSLPGRRRFGLGRCGTSGGGVKCGRWRRRSSPSRRGGRSPPRSSAPERGGRSPPSRGGRRSRRSRRDARPGHRRDGAGAAVGATSPGAVLDDRLEALLARQQLQQAGPRRLLLVRDDRQHPDAVDVVFGLDPQLVADRRPARQDRPSSTPRGSRPRRLARSTNRQVPSSSARSRCGPA